MCSWACRDGNPGPGRPEFDTPKTIGLASGILIGMVTIVAIMEGEQGSLS
jgi:hypothetical protein